MKYQSGVYLFYYIFYIDSRNLTAEVNDVSIDDFLFMLKIAFNVYNCLGFVEHSVCKALSWLGVTVVLKRRIIHSVIEVAEMATRWILCMEKVNPWFAVHEIQAEIWLIPEERTVQRDLMLKNLKYPENCGTSPIIYSRTSMEYVFKLN